jgi:hypothetical protein
MSTNDNATHLIFPDRISLHLSFKEEANYPCPDGYARLVIPAFFSLVSFNLPFCIDASYTIDNTIWNSCNMDYRVHLPTHITIYNSVIASNIISKNI